MATYYLYITTKYVCGKGKACFGGARTKQVREPWNELGCKLINGREADRLRMRTWPCPGSSYVEIAMYILKTTIYRYVPR